jgi:hypothetical protein
MLLLASRKIKPREIAVAMDDNSLRLSTVEFTDVGVGSVTNDVKAA